MKIFKICLLALFTLSVVQCGSRMARIEKEGLAWLQQQPIQQPEIKIESIWISPEWGSLVLKQDGEKLKGSGDGWDISGLVSGKEIRLVFHYQGEVNYSAILKPEDSKLVGYYAYGLMTPDSSKKLMVLTNGKIENMAQSGSQPKEEAKN
jgi:hypothetical protein